MNYSFETRVKVSHSHSVLLWSAKDGTEAGQNLKYTIRSIVCKAFCHPVIWSFAQSVIQSFSHPVI